MRIALLSYRSKPHGGGQGVYVRHLSRELAALGHTVEVFSGQPYPELDPGPTLTKVPSLDLYNDAAPFRTPAEKDEYATAISEASRKLAQLITNILKLNKLENQQIFPQTEEFDLGEQLCACLLQFEDAWESKELNIETEIEEDVRIRSDGELLSLVWNNLISNAVKFTPRGGTVGVCLKTQGDYVVVSVSDTGCGMTPEVGKHIFEKFFQGDTSHATQGNGLGLALVKRVVDILNGEIRVQSVLGKGSTFTVRFRR